MDLEKTIKEKFGNRNRFAIAVGVSPQLVHYWCKIDWERLNYATKEKIKVYVAITDEFVAERLIIGTFSKQGPTKCSGLEISQYDENGLAKVFETHFKKIKCLTTDHITPFETTQNFQFCSFKKLK